jgi:hypothetical protein
MIQKIVVIVIISHLMIYEAKAKPAYVDKFSVLDSSALLMSSDTAKDFNIFRDAKILKNGGEIDSLYILFRYNILKKTDKKYGTLITNLEIAANNGKSTFSNSFSGFEVTSLADGLAKFLVNRVKKELSIAFFQGFKKAINNSSNRDLQVLFYETHTHLNLIDEKIYDFKPYLSGIRTSALVDFKQIPSNLPNLLNTNSIVYEKLKNDTTTLYGLGLSFGLIKELNQKRNLGLALENLTIDPSLKPKNDNIANSVEIIRLISFALKGTGDKSYYLSKEEIAELHNDSLLLEQYIKLIIAYAKLDDNRQPVKIANTAGVYLESILDSKFQELLNILNPIVTSISEVESATEEEKILTYFQLVNQFLEVGKTISKISGNENAEFNTVIGQSQDMVNLLKALYTKNYVTAIAYVTKVYSVTGDNELLKNLTTYGTFIAQISQAENSDEISEILEQFAAPVGSYRDKSIYKFSITLDTYVGAGFGSGKLMDKLKGSFWVNTPIGVSFSVPLCKNLSFTLMPTVLDIGPLVSYRFLNSEGEVSKIYLKEIFSPGIFGSLGFGKKIPVFLNMGWQKAASLTGVNSAENSYNLKPYDLFTASLAVNIPLLSLYNR